MYMQGMWGWSKSEGISYQTPILRIKKLLLRRKFKNKKIIKWKPKSVRDQSQKFAQIILFKGFWIKILKKK